MKLFLSPSQRNSEHTALIKIRRILNNTALSDADCIEQICRVFETLPDMPEADAPTVQKPRS